MSARPGQFKTRPNAGTNGEELLVYNDALYEAFKAALLGTGSPLITNGQTDEKFLRQRQGSLTHHPLPKTGHWIRYEVLSFECCDPKDHQLRHSSDYASPPGYETTIKFLPPVERATLNKLVAQFKDEFIICDIRKLSLPADKTHPDLYESRVGIQFTPGDSSHTRASLQIVKIQIPESEFKKIENKIVTPQVGRP